MSQNYGIASQRPTAEHDGPLPARYLVLIDEGASGARVARLFLESFEPVAEFDAAAPEVVSMIDGLAPTHSAMNPQWDRALAGHTPMERAAADVFTLDV